METTREDNPSEAWASDRLNNLVAISVALLSGFMAITKVKDDNIVQAMQQAKSEAIDTWSEYQSKKIKHHLDDMGIISIRIAQEKGSTSPVANEEITRLTAEVERYRMEEKNLEAKAKAADQLYDTLNLRDDQFDMSDATLSLALTILATVALTRKKPLLLLGWFFGMFGLVTGFAGLLAWNFHPDWLARLLS